MISNVGGCRQTGNGEKTELGFRVVKGNSNNCNGEAGCNACT